VLPHEVYFAILLAVSGYALWRGGEPERLVAAILVLGSIASYAVNLPAQSRYYSVAAGVFAIDLISLAAFVTIALRANRYWPMAVASMHAISVIAHIAKYLDPTLIRTAYSFMIALWIYPMLAVLLIGTIRHRQRLIRNGTDPSWSISSSR
jgi:hypothetical protein